MFGVDKGKATSCVQNLSKNLTQNILAISIMILLIVSSGFSAVTINSGRGSATSTSISYTIDEYSINNVTVNSKKFTTVKLKNALNRRVKSMPALPEKSIALAISNSGNPQVKVVSVEYKEISIANRYLPSKGTIYRNQNPSDIPLTFGEIYNKDEWYPKTNAKLTEPFIMRDIRGITVKISPIQYNPVQGKIRVAKSLQLEITENSAPSINILEKKRSTTSPTYRAIYKKFFANYQSTKTRYDAVADGDRMLIITASKYKSALSELVKWKEKSGIKTELYTYAGGGTSEIKDLIKNRYNGDGLTYVLLVGDNADVPATTGPKGNPSDQAYIYISGDDSYGEALIGRFSVESSAQIEAVVAKNIWYETEATTDWDWTHKAFGIGGDDDGSTGMKDWERIEELRKVLEGYNYTTFDKIYHTPPASDVSTAVNAGRGLGVYIGHGSETMWVTSGFGNSDVKSLSNSSMTPALISVACVNGNFTNNTCFAETWQRVGSKTNHMGAISMLASTINQSWVPPTVGQRAMVDMIADEEYLSWGTIIQNGLCEMVKNSSGSEDMAETWTLFGDPSVVVYTDTPKESGVNSITSIGTGSQTINLTFAAAIDGRISLYSETNGILATKLLSDKSSESLTANIDPAETKLYLTVTGRNLVPNTQEIQVNSGPHITVTTPNGGEKINTGSNYTIKWSASTTGKVSINLYKGSSKVKTVAKDIANTGTYSWSVPADLKDGDDYKIQLSDGSIDDKSDTNFTIGKNVVITYNLKVINGSGSGDYEEGSVISVTAIDSVGYDFIGWSGDVESLSSKTDKSIDVTIKTKDISITATYIKADGGYILMPEGTGNVISVRDSLFYDSEGPTGNYIEKFTGELTLKPAITGKMVQIEFLEFDIEKESNGQVWDTLIIYNGSNKSEQLGYWYGNNSPGTIVSTADDGSITIKFNSDDADVGAGWKAHITLVDPVAVIAKSFASKPLSINILGSNINFQLPLGINKNMNLVTLNLYSLNGVKIASYTNDLKMGHAYSIPINSITKNGLSKGIYIARLKGESFNFSRKLILR